MDRTLSDLENELFGVEVEISMLKKTLKAVRAELDNHKKLKSDASVGLKKAEENLKNLYSAPVVLLSESQNVKSLCKNLKDRLEVAQTNIEVATNSVKKLEVQLSAAEKEHQKLVGSIENYNNILRFPTNDTRRSEETSE